MDNRLGGNNTQQRLIGGQTAPQSAPRRESGDVFVANVGEKRYLWTARAFAIITAISLCCNVVLSRFSLRFSLSPNRFTTLCRCAAI